jgi:Flp pilus assembly protein TadG
VLLARQQGERGQSTVELALALPVVTIVLLVLVQIAVIARDHVLVTHAAREAARAAAVGATDTEAARAAARSTGLRRERLVVSVAGPAATGAHRTITVRYRTPTDVPIIGRLLADVEMGAKVTIRAE